MLGNVLQLTDVQMNLDTTEVLAGARGAIITYLVHALNVLTLSPHSSSHLSKIVFDMRSVSKIWPHAACF
jgi:hypothetical protein